MPVDGGEARIPHHPHDPEKVARITSTLRDVGCAGGGLGGRLSGAGNDEKSIRGYWKVARFAVAVANSCRRRSSDGSQVCSSWLRRSVNRAPASMTGELAANDGFVQVAIVASDAASPSVESRMPSESKVMKVYEARVTAIARPPSRRTFTVASFTRLPLNSGNGVGDLLLEEFVEGAPSKTMNLAVIRDEVVTRSGAHRSILPRRWRTLTHR